MGSESWMHQHEAKELLLSACCLTTQELDTFSPELKLMKLFPISIKTTMMNLMKGKNSCMMIRDLFSFPPHHTPNRGRFLSSVMGGYHAPILIGCGILAYFPLLNPL